MDSAFSFRSEAVVVAAPQPFFGEAWLGLKCFVVAAAQVALRETFFGTMILVGAA